MLTIEDLTRLQRYLKISALAKDANISENTLTAKIRNQRQLTVTESDALEGVLRGQGIIIEKPLRPPPPAFG